ncbi:hypothetical protein BJ085DRAFT_37079 [Dimargaris cristalligena]|uniref:HDAg domain-containing protein n=1 Tax=Dimargaris cristalligena TaxID=215637 RepID=A0A4Q0A1Y2_9FUNG|nr:hypothetical protein BJ085DRAFT_37079 [Dimargaris cristalligena]|eukprot:RKP40136.1 hypothetical protein BJ085DRAFT_37079 [Dimargaris cristalligena]
MSGEQKVKLVQDWLTQIHNNHPHFRASAILASEMTLDNFPYIMALWSSLDSGIKLNLLFSAAIVRKGMLPTLLPFLEQGNFNVPWGEEWWDHIGNTTAQLHMLAVAITDKDSWVSTIARVLQPYPSRGTINLATPELTQLNQSAMETLREAQINIAPKDYALLNSPVRERICPRFTSIDILQTNRAVFQVQPKAQIAHTDRLDALRQAAKDAINGAKSGLMFTKTQPPAGMGGVGSRPGAIVSPTHPSKPVIGGLSRQMPPSAGVRPGMPGSNPAISSLFVNRKKPATGAASFLRPSAPKPANTAINRVIPAGVTSRPQKQSRVKMLDIDEAQSINKQQEETKIRTKENEIAERENKRLQAKKEAEERKIQEQERKKELQRERLEKRAQRQKQKEEEVAIKAVKRQTRKEQREAAAKRKADEESDDDGDNVDSDGDGDIDTGVTNKSKFPRNSRKESTSDDIESGEDRGVEVNESPSGPTKRRRLVRRVSRIPDSDADDLPDYEDNEGDKDIQVTAKPKPTRSAPTAKTVDDDGDEEDDDDDDGPNQGDMKVDTSAAANQPTTASLPNNDLSDVPPQLHDLVGTIFRHSNVLNPVDRRVIIDFLSGNQDRQAPNIDDSGVYRAAVHQQIVADPATGAQMIEHIDFEIDYNTGHWRQMKRRSQAA